jgi:hypothetical protein
VVAMIVVLAETANDVVTGLIIVAAAPVTAASAGSVLVVGAMSVRERAGGKVIWSDELLTAICGGTIVASISHIVKVSDQLAPPC